MYEVTYVANGNYERFGCYETESAAKKAAKVACTMRITEKVIVWRGGSGGMRVETLVRNGKNFQAV